MRCRTYTPAYQRGVYHGSQGILVLRWGFPLRCFQRLSRPYIAMQHCRWRDKLLHQRYVHPGPLVLGTNPLKIPTPTADRTELSHDVLEPSSRTTLIGEQPNPWDLLQPQDVMSDIEVPNDAVDMDSWASSACYSPAYLFIPLSDGPIHAGPPDHYDRLSSLLDLLVSQSGRLYAIILDERFRPF